MTTIFTPVQIRRNRKAIAAAIEENRGSLVPSLIDQLAEEMAAKYVWQERRDAYRAQIVQELTAAGLNSGSMNSYSRKEEARERRDANRAANVMASRAPVADVEVIECDRRGEVIDQDYTIATTDGIVIAQVEHHDVTDTVTDDASAEIERLQEELDERTSELEKRTADLESEQEQHEALKKRASEWEKAWYFLEEIQDHAVHALPVVEAIDRATLQLSYDGWNDRYVQQDITDAIEAARALSNNAASMYDDYLQA